MIVFLMGVSGSGKSTIGPPLALKLHAEYADGDDFHSAANKAKMAGGTPLDDEDRKPWLAALNTLAKEKYEAGLSLVLACSALKQSYRDTLTVGLPTEQVEFVLLEGSKAMLAARLRHREGHFMGPALLDSQLQTLELPEDALRVVNDRSVEDVVESVLTGLRERQAAAV